MGEIIRQQETWILSAGRVCGVCAGDGLALSTSSSFCDSLKLSLSVCLSVFASAGERPERYLRNKVAPHQTKNLLLKGACKLLVYTCLLCITPLARLGRCISACLYLGVYLNVCVCMCKCVFHHLLLTACVKLFSLSLSRFLGLASQKWEGILQKRTWR